ncbi:MAG: DUF1398 family protein [Asticcacaulis sp.]
MRFRCQHPYLPAGRQQSEPCRRRTLPYRPSARGKDLLHADGESLVVRTKAIGGKVACDFDAAGVEAAVRAIQRREIGYVEFCEWIAGAGCASYIVSLAGRRAVYYGRTGETFVEPFPQAA